MNDETARQGRSAIYRYPATLASVPVALIEIPFEGDAVAVIRGCRSEADLVSMRAWLAADEDLRELCRLARRIRDRRDIADRRAA